MSLVGSQVLVAPSLRCQPKVAFAGANLPRSGRLASRHVGAAAAVVPRGMPTPAPPQTRDLMNHTYYPKGEDAAAIRKQWYLIDADGQILGRLATLAAVTLRGKTSPAYTPSMDMGGYVVIINAEKVAVTGKKETQKTYFRHTVGRPGHYKIETLRDLRKRIPERILEKAIKGMLPKGRLGSQLFRHLKVYKGPNHPHVAQQPEDITHHIDRRPSEIAAINKERAEQQKQKR